MTSLIEVYWKYIGTYLGRLFGKIVDLFPFSISELLLQLSIWFTLLLILCFCKSIDRPKLYWIGPIILSIMVSSQGILPFDWVPTAHRRMLVDHLNLKAMERDQVTNFLELKKQQLKNFPAELYKEAPLDPPLELVNQSIRKAMEKLKLVPGREIQSVKNLWGITRTLGLAYGGPAYHDVVTSEVVIASHKDYPASKAWRWICVVHEAAHAQGFTREMDAEIITWIALKESEDELMRSLSDWMACLKSGQDFDVPAVMLEEWKEVGALRERLNQPLIDWLRNLGQKINIQNHGDKYGSVEKDHEIPLDHEFYQVLVNWSSHAR